MLLPRKQRQHYRTTAVDAICSVTEERQAVKEGRKPCRVAHYRVTLIAAVPTTPSADVRLVVIGIIDGRGKRRALPVTTATVGTLLTSVLPCLTSRPPQRAVLLPPFCIGILLIPPACRNDRRPFGCAGTTRRTLYCWFIDCWFFLFLPFLLYVPLRTHIVVCYIVYPAFPLVSYLYLVLPFASICLPAAAAHFATVFVLQRCLTVVPCWPSYMAYFRLYIPLA